MHVYYTSIWYTSHRVDVLYRQYRLQYLHI